MTGASQPMGTGVAGMYRGDDKKYCWLWPLSGFAFDGTYIRLAAGLTFGAGFSTKGEWPYGECGSIAEGV